MVYGFAGNVVSSVFAVLPHGVIGAVFIDVILVGLPHRSPSMTIRSHRNVGGLLAQCRRQTRSRRFAKPTERGIAAIAGSTPSMLSTKAT